MARGWESKSVEEQMAKAAKKPEVGPGEAFETEDARRLAASQRAAREREKQSLNLQRENILSQRTSNPGRRQALEAALAQIEGQLSAMG
jgi:hypothetical protein